MTGVQAPFQKALIAALAPPAPAAARGRGRGGRGRGARGEVVAPMPQDLSMLRRRGGCVVGGGARNNKDNT